MGRCIDCVHYPWQRDADPAYLPAQRCHPKLRARRWSQHTLTEPNHCPLFEPIEGAEVDPVTVPEPEPEPEPEPAAATSEGIEAETDAGGDAAADVQVGDTGDGEVADHAGEVTADGDVVSDGGEGGDGGARVFNLPPKVQTKRVKQKGGGKS